MKSTKNASRLPSWFSQSLLSLSPGRAAARADEILWFGPRIVNSLRASLTSESSGAFLEPPHELGVSVAQPDKEVGTDGAEKHGTKVITEDRPLALIASTRSRSSIVLRAFDTLSTETPFMSTRTK